MKQCAAFLFILSVLVINGVAQYSSDSLLFSITLNDDSLSLYGCRWDDKVQSSLGGPILMINGQLLFYSRHGYVLYNEKGKLLDSHSLFKENKKRKNGENPIELLFPLDSITLLYCRKPGNNQSSVELFKKTLYKKNLEKVSSEINQAYLQSGSGRFFNLVNNNIIDEMNKDKFLKPQLVGFSTTSEKAARWWTVDKFFSITSPIIVEKEGAFQSFYPGIKKDQKCEVDAHLVEPLGVFSMNGQYFYHGLYTTSGNQDDQYFQVVVISNQNGNILYRLKILKQDITDAVLQHVEESNTNYTVRRAERHVFVPNVDGKGNVFFGMIDFNTRKINVYKKFLTKYNPEICKPALKPLFDYDDGIVFTPMVLNCDEMSGTGVYPEFTKWSDTGLVNVNSDEMERQGYSVKIFRSTDSELKKKLARIQKTLPEHLQTIQDSLVSLETSWCPYAVGLYNAKKGRIGTFHYGIDEIVFSVRILETTATDIFVRVDLENRAEIVVFSPDGEYRNGFVFNQKNYRERRDQIVVSKDMIIVERDYEHSTKGARYMQWKRKF